MILETKRILVKRYRGVDMTRLAFSVICEEWKRREQAFMAQF